jgi:hypothetical protein
VRVSPTNYVTTEKRSIEEVSELDNVASGNNTRSTLFEPDDVDTTLRRNAPKAILFNDDMVELLRDLDFSPDQSRSISAPVRTTSSSNGSDIRQIFRRPSLFDNDENLQSQGDEKE